MAIIIKQDIDEYLPVYNRLEVSVVSGNIALANFKYIFDLYIEGVAGFIRFKVPPEPNTGLGFGVKDFMRTIESHVESFLLKEAGNLSTGFILMTESIVKYHIQYGEEYDVAGVITPDPDLLIGADKYAWNASFSFNDRVRFAFNDYNLSSGVGQWLTDQKTNDIGILDVGYSGVIASVDTDIEFLEVITYDSGGVLINTFKMQNILVNGQTASKYTTVATSPVNLNNITLGLVVGIQPVIDSAVASYTCQILDAVSSPIGDILTFNLQEQCNYPIRRLHFQNRYGMFDAFNFDLVSKEDVNIEKKSFKFKPTRIDGAGLISYSESDRSNINYRIKSTNQIQLNANYITEEQSIWLEQLFTSPEIYLEHELDNAKKDKVLISVSEIQSSKYRIKTDKVDNLYNIDLIITLSNNNYRQRR